MVNLNIFAFLLYSLNRKNSVGLQDFKNNAFLKKSTIFSYYELFCWLAGFIFCQGLGHGEVEKSCPLAIDCTGKVTSLVLSKVNPKRFAAICSSWQSDTLHCLCLTTVRLGEGSAKLNPGKAGLPPGREEAARQEPCLNTRPLSFSLFFTFFLFSSLLHFLGRGERNQSMPWGSSAWSVLLRLGRYPGARWSAWNPSEAIRSLYSFRPEENKFLRVSGESVRNNIQLFNCMSFLIVAEEDMSTLLLTGTLWQWIFSPYIEHGKRQGAERPCKKSPCSYFHITNRW